MTCQEQFEAFCIQCIQTGDREGILSRKAGVGRSAVQAMRRGRPVWRNTAQHVAAALGVPLEELLEVSE